MSVRQVAKEFRLASKDPVDMLTKLGVDVRNHASTIEDADAAKLRGLVRNGSAPAGPATPKPPAPAPATTAPPGASRPRAPAGGRPRTEARSGSGSRRAGGGRCRTGRSSGSQR